MTNRLPLIGVAGTRSGVGKTIVTLALIEGERSRGIEVQPFKVGPDFLDPLYHRAVAGRPSVCLDPFFSDIPQLNRLVKPADPPAQIGVVEGVMGLFDGREEAPFAGSTAALFRDLDIPFLLVVDGRRRSHSLAAEVKGYRELWPGLDLRAVVVNRAGSPRHRRMIEDALTKSEQGPVVFVPRSRELELPSRHLGLSSRDALSRGKAFREQLRSSICPRLNPIRKRFPSPLEKPPAPSTKSSSRSTGDPPVIGVARDCAFHFYYRRNLRMLERSGARLKTVSPLEDERLPGRLDGLYIGGGYPEEHARALESNRSFMEDLRARLEAGLPVFAECGGLIYLSKRLRTNDETETSMVGWLPLRFTMNEHHRSLSYVQGRFDESSPFGTEGQSVRGHEFHYSEAEPESSLPTALELSRGQGMGEGRDGLTKGNVLACYSHLYFGSCPSLPEGLVGAARRQDSGAVHVE